MNLKTPTAESNPNKLGVSTFKAASVTGPAVYYLGIVDFLQDWSTKKKIERAFKMYFARKDPDGLSVMHPKYYKMRFQTKMDQIFDLEGVTTGSEANPRFALRTARDAAVAALSTAGDSTKSAGPLATQNRKPFADDVVNPLQQSQVDEDINVEVVDL